MSPRKNPITPFLALAVALATSSCSHLVNREKDMEKARIHLQRGVDAFNERQYNQAIDSTQEALKYDPNLAGAYNHLALIYMETKRYQKSEEAFTKALELQAEYPEVHNNIGVLLNRQEKYGDAIPHFEKALKSDRYGTPENAYTNMGYSYFKLGNTARAKAYHQKALDVSPLFCLASKNMGDVYTKEKHFQKAVDYFQKAITHCPLFQEAHYKLGLVMMKMGRKDLAKNQLERLVERHKSGPYVERSQEVLKYLH